MHPPAVGVQVTVAKVEDVPRVFAFPAEVKKSEPQTIKLDAAGTVLTVAAENDEVTPESALVVLDAQAKLDKELADVHTKIEQLEKKVEASKGKAKQDAQTKLDERHARLGEVEALIKKATLKPSRPGTVSKVLVKVGDVVAPGTDAVSVVDKTLVAELKVPALEAQGIKAGQEAKVSAGSSTINVQIVRAATEGEFTTLVLSLPLDATVKLGDKVSLQRGLLEKVVRVPAAALVEGTKVYVMRDGKAVAQAITVADRDGDSVLLQGLSSGDQIIVSHPPELHEGSAVQPAAAAPTMAPAAGAPAAPAPAEPAAK
jgi:biotin carboxyl carrier protein